MQLSKIFIYPLVFFALILNSAFAQKLICQFDDPARSPRERHTDMEWLEATLHFKPEEGKVLGEVTHKFRWIRSGFDTLFLDAPGINIISVLHQGRALKYYTNNDGVVLKFPVPSESGRQEQVTLKYEAKPRKGIYFIGWDNPNPKVRRQIWTQGQGTDNRFWLPMYDEMNDKIKTRLRIYFDSAYTVLSNGVLINKQPQRDGTQLWEYVMEKPHAPYLIMLGIGKYEIRHQKAASGVPLALYMYPDRMADFETTYHKNREIFDFLEQEIGIPYPWPSYAQIPVQEYIYGAMENTTATVFGDFFIVDERAFHDRNYIAVNAHELAHQWFGDLVTARSARHHWLQESFATYYNWLYEREYFGQDHYDWNRRQAQISAFNESKKNTLPIAHSKAGSTRHYPKGAFVLHMLSGYVGRENYRRAIQRYLQTHAFENVTSDDLLKAFHDELGIGLEWFWDQWIYGGGEPELEVLETIDSKEHQLLLTLRQKQQGEGIARPFKLPLEIDLHYSDGSYETKSYFLDTLEAVLSLPFKKGTKLSFTVVDPGNQILRVLHHEKSVEALQAQVLRGRYMLDRYDALTGLREKTFTGKKELLKQVYTRETFWAIKGEALRQLMKEFGKDKDVRALWLQALTDKDNNLRKEAIVALETSRESDLTAELLRVTDLKDASYGLLESTLRYLSQEDPEKANSFIAKITPLIYHPSANSLRVTVYEVSAKINPSVSQAFTDSIIHLASPDYEFRTRTAAFQALGRLKHYGDKALEYALQAYFSPNQRLASAARQYLKEGRKENHFEENLLLKKAAAFPDFKEKNVLIKELTDPLLERK
jgi:aminopeptidase N